MLVYIVGDSLYHHNTPPTDNVLCDGCVCVNVYGLPYCRIRCNVCICDVSQRISNLGTFVDVMHPIHPSTICTHANMLQIHSLCIIMWNMTMAKYLAFDII